MSLLRNVANKSYVSTKSLCISLLHNRRINPSVINYQTFTILFIESWTFRSTLVITKSKLLIFSNLKTTKL